MEEEGLEPSRIACRAIMLPLHYSPKTVACYYTKGFLFLRWPRFHHVQSQLPPSTLARTSRLELPPFSLTTRCSTLSYVPRIYLTSPWSCSWESNPDFPAFEAGPLPNWARAGLIYGHQPEIRTQIKRDLKPLPLPVRLAGDYYFGGHQEIRTPTV